MILVDYGLKKRKIRPFRMIEQMNKVHLFERRDVDDYFLICSFKKGEDF